MQRRDFLASSSTLAIGTGLLGVQGSAGAQERRFAPQPGAWRTFEMTTRIELGAPGPARIWIPLPSVEDSYQPSTTGSWPMPIANRPRPAAASATSG